MYFLVDKNHSSWETLLVTKLCLCRKNEITTNIYTLDKRKTSCPRFLVCPAGYVFQFKKNYFKRYFFGFLLKESLFSSALNKKFFTIRCESHGFSCHSTEPPGEAKTPQPWPAASTFHTICCGLLHQSPFVQCWSTRPGVYQNY